MGDIALLDKAIEYLVHIELLSAIHDEEIESLKKTRIELEELKIKLNNRFTYQAYLSIN